MQGVPWQPVPTRHGQHILVEIDENGDVPNEIEENETPPKEDAGADEGDPEYQKQKQMHGLHVSRKAIMKYGTTEGCPAYNHNITCRTRILQAMRDDPAYRRLVHKHQPHQQAGDIEILTEAQV